MARLNCREEAAASDAFEAAHDAVSRLLCDKSGEMWNRAINAALEQIEDAEDEFFRGGD